jgi:DNA polymerase/3'-5' exonuclease PolX
VIGCRDRSSPATSGRTCGKRIAEALANQCYQMELDNAPGQGVWAYRKAAWAIEDLEQDVGLIYERLGRKGLESIENVGPRLARVTADLGRILRLTNTGSRCTLYSSVISSGDRLGLPTA